MTDRLPAVAAPITEDDAFLARAVRSSSVPALMMSLIHLSGDTSLLDGPIQPGPATLGEVQGAMNEADKTEIRQRAAAALIEYRERGCTLPPPPDAATVHRMMSFMVGQEVPDEYVPMMLEEMALDGRDWRAADLGAAASAVAARGFRVLVIGAGMSGLLAAIRLEEAGIPYVVIEKNDGIGGTWFENTYPGCRVDIANHFYCYSFEPNHDWSQYYSQQQELRAYFERCADKYGVREHIRFRTEVVSARFDAAAATWKVSLRGPAGEETVAADVLISAVGQLNRPKIPDLPGLSSFAGPVFHSAEWQHQHDLDGKRVAVIGTGASALQLVPEVAEVASRLYVLQRSAAWMFPNPSYHRRVSDNAKWLFKHVPYYARWYRFLLFWPGSDGLLPSLIVDPAWPHQDRSINAANEETRIQFTEYISQQVHGDPALLAKVIPPYPPFGKRILQDNGSWLAALQRDNVELVTDAIEEIEPDGIRTADGKHRQIDAIVFATGFHANKFLWPMDIVGRSGRTLNETWGDDPRAYLGITVPDFPNLFCLYGPGTNLAHAGSIIFHSECQVRYVMGCIAAMLAGQHATIECRAEVCDEFNRRLDAALARTVWAHPGMTSWYKNQHGRVTTTSPWRLVDYWNWTRAPDLGDFVLS